MFLSLLNASAGALADASCEIRAEQALTEIAGYFKEDVPLKAVEAALSNICRADGRKVYRTRDTRDDSGRGDCRCGDGLLIDHLELEVGTGTHRRVPKTRPPK